MNVKNSEELLKILDSHKIAIYGAGYVATRFYEGLKINRLDDRVDCFVTTTGGKDCINGKKNIAIDDFEYVSSYVMCIAVHESVRDEIIAILESKNIENYIWIHPFLYELLLGKPIEKRVNIPLKKIVQKAVDYYAIAIRYLAIGQYYGENKVGYELYIKAQSLHCDKYTAIKRLNQFIGLIESWEKNGYDTSKEITVLENHIIIDGFHRTALAVYHKSEYIVGNIVRTEKDIYAIHSEAGFMTKRCLIDNGFSMDEIKLLDETNRKIEENYNIGKEE